MSQRFRGIVSLLLVLGLAGGLPAAFAQRSAFTGKELAPPPPAPAESAPAEEADPVAAGIEQMSLKRKVSQLMVVTLQGVTGPAVDDFAFLKSYTPGGAIIRQLIKPATAVSYVTRLRGVEQLTGIPLLVGANLYELTKRGRNLPSAYVQLPSPLSIAAAQDPENTEKLAELLAQFLVSMGFNLHLGPNLALAPTLKEARGDIYNFGSKPEFVGEAGLAMVKAMNAAGVLATPMGFPGGGLNRLPKTRAVLLTPGPLLAETDLYPFKQIIEAGAPMLHVGNTLAPGIDPRSCPASLSDRVMRDLLREELGYTGVILAGPMDSPDILDQYDAAEAAVIALQSGADMLYWRGADNLVMRVIDRLVSAVEEGRLAAALIDQALERVLQMKEVHFSGERPEIDEQKASALEHKKKIVDQVYEIERRSITLVKNSGKLIPLNGSHAMPIGLTGVVGVNEMHPYLEEYAKPIPASRLPRRCISGKYRILKSSASRRISGVSAR